LIQQLPERNVRLWQDSQEIVRYVSADFTLTDKDDHILVDSSAGNVTITLPPMLNGKRYWVIHETGNNGCIIQPSAGDSIVLPYGATSVTIFAGSSLVFKGLLNNQWGIE